MKNLISRLSGKRVLAAFLSLMIFMGVFFSIPFSANAAGNDYITFTDADRQKIADYALDLALNPALKRSLAVGGGDCTSFTSNCLLAGGISFDKTSSNKWYCYDDSMKANWQDTAGMWSYMQAHEGMTGAGISFQRIYGLGSHSGLNTQVKPGDLIYFEGHHFGVVVVGGNKSSEIVTANHSRNTLMRVDWWADAYSDNPRIAVYRVTGYHTQTLLGSQAPIAPAPYERGSIYFQTDEKVSMTMDSNIDQNFSSGIPKVIAIQTYKDLRYPDAVGYCSDFNLTYNGEGAMNPAGTVTDSKVIKVLSYGYINKSQTVADINAKLGLSGSNALQSISECEYVTQMGIYLALGQVQRSGSQLKYGSHNINKLDISPYQNTREFFGVSSPMADPAMQAASARVYNAVLRLSDIINDSGIATPPSTAPALTLNPPNPNKCVYNASQDAFFAGPYSVSSTGSASNYTVDLIGNTVGATVVNTSYSAQTTFNWGQQFYIKVPKTAGVSDLTVRASARFAVAPEADRYTAVSGNSQGVIIPKPNTSNDTGRDDENLRIETFGKINVHKVTDKNEALAGVSFGVYSDAGCTSLVKDPVNNRDVILVTDSSGNATSPDLLPYTFYVKEMDMSPEQHLVLNMNPTVYQIAVQAGVTTPINANAGTVVNKYKTIQIQIDKQNAQPGMMTYSLAGAVFEIRNTTTGQKWQVTTSAEGLASQDNIPLGFIEIEEIQSPAGFQRNPEIKFYDLRKGEKGVDVIVQKCIYPEYPQVGKITVTKFDQVTYTRAQGDSKLTGAVFTLHAAEDIKYLDGSIKYKKDELIQRLPCGANSTSVTSMEVPLGNFYIMEEAPPIGMNPLPAETKIPVNIYFHDQEVRCHVYDASVYNKVIEGRIELVKHDDTPNPTLDPENPNVENPMNNVKFRIWLVSAGSYENALESERDEIITGQVKDGQIVPGWCQSKLLPYGLYQIDELSDENTQGHDTIKSYRVFIDTEKKTYYYILRDDTSEARVRILKHDMEDNRLLPVDCSFKIRDMSTGEFITQRMYYPIEMEVSTFHTDPETGALVTLEPLKYGDYEICEIESCYLYLLNVEPLPFSIKENSDEIIEIPFYNAPAKGTVSIHKTGQMLVGSEQIASDFGTIFQPKYEQVGLQGVQYDIICEEDVWYYNVQKYKKGDIVARLITGADGWATSKPLYLGKFYAVEVNVGGNEMVIDRTEQHFELCYLNQHTVLVNENLYPENIRQQVSIELEKIMEKPVWNDTQPDGYNPYSNVVFGLFAKNAVNSVDGSLAIPADALVALIPVGSDGKGVIQGEYPFTEYIIRELSTNSAYQLDSSKEYPISAVYQGSENAVAHIKVNNGGKITNDLIRGTLEVLKTGDMLTGVTETDTPHGKVYTPKFEEKGLAGVSFDVVAAEDHYDVTGKLIHKKGEITASIETDETGIASIGGLHLGKWLLIETGCKITGYIVDSTPIPFTLAIDDMDGSEIIEFIDVKNERAKVQFEINKIFEEDPILLQKPSYKDVVFGLFATEDITDNTGETIIKAGDMVAILALDENCQIPDIFMLPFSKFTLREIATSPLCILSDEEYTIDLSNPAIDADTVVVIINDGEPIINELKKAQIKVIKTDGNTKTPLPGVVFEVRDENGNVVCEIVTQEDGTAITGLLPLQKYILVEKSTLTEYVLDQAPVEIILTEHEKVYELELENVKIKGQVRIFKYDGTNRDPIQGVVFGIYNEEGELAEEIITDADGYALSGYHEYGKYKIIELSTVQGFKLDQTPFELEITENNKIYELSFKNERIPEEPTTPKTGSNDNTMIWFIVALVSLGGVVLAASVRRRKPESKI